MHRHSNAKLSCRTSPLYKAITIWKPGSTGNPPTGDKSRIFAKSCSTQQQAGLEQVAHRNAQRTKRNRPGEYKNIWSTRAPTMANMRQHAIHHCQCNPDGANGQRQANEQSTHSPSPLIASNGPNRTRTPNPRNNISVSDTTCTHNTPTAANTSNTMRRSHLTHHNRIIHKQTHTHPTHGQQTHK